MKQIKKRLNKSNQILNKLVNFKIIYNFNNKI